jgi:epoxide hydrolase-like predicted phosphatase
MAIRAVIFDLGGVLLRSEDPTPRRLLAERLGLPLEQIYYHVFDSLSAQQATVGKISVSSHWETVRQSLGLSTEEFPSAVEAFWAGDRLDMALVDAIRALRPRYKTALLSNAWDNLRPALENEWNIADAFDELFISAELGVAKPDACIYELALRCLQVSPPEAVFVDDFLDNVTAARQLGIHAIHFRNTTQALGELHSLLDGQL